MLAEMETVFSSQFHINSTKHQSFTFEFVWLDPEFWHLNDHPELHIDNISNNYWGPYIKELSTPGTWCDNIIIQALSNAHNCVIHITESDVNKPEGTIITPVVNEGKLRIFIGYINGLHYVSTIPNKINSTKNRLKYLKSKLIESNNQNQERLSKKRKTRSMETKEKRETRLTNQRPKYTKQRSVETVKKRREKLKKGVMNTRNSFVNFS